MPRARATVRALADDGRRRRPADGGYARGDETRARIISAALDVFGTHGFGGASTRMLAESAGVTLPALHYYFDSKEGVYLACAEHIAERLDERFRTLTDGTSAATEATALPRGRVLDTLLSLVDGFADFFLGAHELEKWVMFIIREQAQPTKAFDIIFERVMQRTFNTLATIVGRLLERPVSDMEVRIRTFTLIGQLVFFRTAREAALRVTGLRDFDGERLKFVKRVLRTQIAAAFAPETKSPRRRRS
jgi:TetR/AcrR family transcriptional regulator, regulator of cefoperazone and chloramphenicol sensitivity